MKILTAFDWLDLHLLDEEYPEAKIWEKWITKVGRKHASQNSWTFTGKMLLITLDEDNEVTIYLCEEDELECGDVYDIIAEARGDK